MKRNPIVKFAALLVICCMFFGCKPEDEIEKFGIIYGTVTDFASGEPISNVNVRLNPRGETTLTGSDGTFQFNDLAAGSYSLSLSKNGYVDLDDDYVIKIENGNTVQRAIQMQKELKGSVSFLSFNAFLTFSTSLFSWMRLFKVSYWVPAITLASEISFNCSYFA